MAIFIKWNRKALQQFDEAIAYINARSPHSADKVQKDLLAKIDGLLKHPERYNLDKYKKDNNGSFRAFEIYHYRISYRYKKDEVRILRLRHTSMNPTTY